jgi:hypothetical protein
LYIKIVEANDPAIKNLKMTAKSGLTLSVAGAAAGSVIFFCGDDQQISALCGMMGSRY